MDMNPDSPQETLAQFKAGAQIIDNQLSALPTNDFVIMWGDSPLLRSNKDRVIGLIGDTVFTMSSRILMTEMAKRFAAEVAKVGEDTDVIKAMPVHQAIEVFRARNQRLIDSMEQKLPQ